MFKIKQLQESVLLEHNVPSYKNFIDEVLKYYNNIYLSAQKTLNHAMSFHALDFRAVVYFRKRARNIFKNLDLKECGFFLAEVEELRGQIASAPFELL